MRELLQSETEVLDTEDAGTTMRFLTAYLAIGNSARVLTGSARMKNRPIGLLVDALRQIGARIHYLEKNGYPPLRIEPFKGQLHNTVTLRGDVSSQFISALMMIAPVLPNGLTIDLEGEVTSRPYIDMTAALMQKFGVVCVLRGNRIEIRQQPYRATHLTIEPDWSAASYWFSFTALARDAAIVLPGIALRAIQGDRVIVDIMELLGVKSEPRGNDLILTKKEARNELTWDFKNCPDLAQTVAVVCAAKGIPAIFTGLESLRIKETDRISALQAELKKLGALLTEKESTWQILPSQLLPESIEPIHTYLDHRMAMAFAPLAALRDITIENPQVVKKSYPHFWRDVQSLGISLSGL